LDTTTTTTTVKRTAFFNFGFAGSARTLKPSPLLLSKFENNRTLLEEKEEEEEEEEEEVLLVDAAADDDTELIVNIFIIFASFASEEKRLVFGSNFVSKEALFRYKILSAFCSIRILKLWRQR